MSIFFGKFFNINLDKYQRRPWFNFFLSTHIDQTLPIFNISLNKRDEQQAKYVVKKKKGRPDFSSSISGVLQPNPQHMFFATSSLFMDVIIVTKISKKIASHFTSQMLNNTLRKFISRHTRITRL